MSDLWIALLLLSPVEIPVGETATPEEWAALKSLSLKLQIVGEHEQWMPSFRSEVGYCRYYARALADAPPIADAALLPSSRYATDATRLSAEYATWLEWQIFIAPYRAEVLAPISKDACRRSWFWVDVCQAQRDTDSWAKRRKALAKVRDAVGVEAYYAGRWPWPVAWREAD